MSRKSRRKFKKEAMEREYQKNRERLLKKMEELKNENLLHLQGKNQGV